jgi:hypothetical protein
MVLARLEKVENEVRMFELKVEEAGGVQQVKKITRHPLSYGAYLKVKNLEAAGRLSKAIASETGIPYTTVRRYQQMTALQVSQLPEYTGPITVGQVGEDG